MALEPHSGRQPCQPPPGLCEQRRAHIAGPVFRPHHQEESLLRRSQTMHRARGAGDSEGLRLLRILKASVLPRSPSPASSTSPLGPHLARSAAKAGVSTTISWILTDAGSSSGKH